jgi:type I restriction enzyme M protein
MISSEEIEKKDFNLNLPRYIDSQVAEDIQDIEGHLKGGIPARDIDALQPYWDVCTKLRKALFKDSRPGYLDLAVDKSAIKSTIYEHPEYVKFTSQMIVYFATWRKKSSTMLKALKTGCHPKEIITELSEDILTNYTNKPLIDKYDVYQHLMDYWAETMQDDCYIIASDGWKAETYRIIEKDKKGKEKDKGWACDLVPKSLIVARYFAKEQKAIENRSIELETVTARMTELEEEHGGDEGAFSEFEKVNKANIASRLKEIQNEKESKDEAAVLNEWLKLANEETGLKKQIKDAENELDGKTYDKYPKLTKDEIKSLIVEDKWLAKLEAALNSEIGRISQVLTQRVKELTERYETPMPQLISHVAKLEAKVNSHLEKMGYKWK